MTESTIESSAEVVGAVEEVRIQVLHVDDEPGFLKVAKQCLEMQGLFQVETAASVEEAMEKLERKDFDAIVSDHLMPGKDGLEFLKELRHSGNNIPFIMFTGKSTEEVAIKAVNLGADGYFNKVGNPEAVYGELSHGIRQSVERKKAEEALRRSENYLETILSSVLSGLVVIDAETHEIVDVNPEALRIMGGSREHVIGKMCHCFICPAEEGRCPISDLGQGVDKSERVLLTTDGERIPILKTVTLATWKGHKYIIESFIDITGHKKAEKAIRESQERFERLFMNNPEATVYVGSDFHILHINSRFEELFGYSLDEIRGKHIDDVIVPKDKMEEAKILAKRFMKENVYYDTVRKRKDGSLIPVSISAAPITVEGQPLGYVGSYKDVTERKRFEERLSALNVYSRNLNMAGTMKEIYRLTLDAMEKTLGFEHAFFMVVDKDMLCVVDQRGYPVDISIKLPLDGSKRGVSVEVARTGKPINVPDAEKEDAWVEFCPGIRSGLDVPVKIRRKVLGVIGVDSKSLNAFDEKDQKLLEILASHAATAISNLEHAKDLEAYAREIRESQKKFERLFTNNPEATAYLGPDFRILDTNPRFTELFGYSLDEIRGKHINSIIVPEDKIEEAETFDKRAGKGETYQEDTVRKGKDGTLVPVSFSAAPIIVKNKAIGHVAMYKDISQLKKTEKTIRESQQKFQRLFMNNPEAADYLDPDFRIIDVNPRFTELFGYSLDESRGKHINDVIVPEDMMEEAKMLDEKAGENIVSYDTVRKRKDGSLVPVSISAAPIIVEGKLIGTVGLYKDISQLRKAEKTLTNTLEKLETVNEKLRVVGRLTRHDVRNKLAAVTGNVYLAKKKLPDDHKAMEQLAGIVSAVRQVEKIFDFARTYERLGAEELVYIGVEKDVEGALALFSDLQDVKVVNDCRGLTVLADSLLRQLFYNLIDNSLKYGKKITQIRVHYEESNEDGLKLVYQDDGVGISKAEKEKIFKEGYGKGTGYGLYLIRKICEVYGWTIKETGKHGKGARFLITIPKTNESGKIAYRLH